MINKSAYLDRQNYNCIDLVKFMCAIMVVMLHIKPLGVSEIKIINYINFGIQNYITRIAVPFFFVTSGFLLYKKTSLDSFSVDPTIKYVKHIFKLYFLWSLLYFPFRFISFFDDEKGIKHAVLLYIRDFLFNGSYTHLWYLPATIFSVLLVSFMIYKKIPIKRIILVALIFYLLGLFAQSWFGFIRPIKDFAPILWKMLKLTQNVIVTTRDGLFEGFLFVGVGMLFAMGNISISKKVSFVGFSISMAFMFAEVFILQYVNFIRYYDMYLFLIPTTFFMFSLVKQVNLPDRPIYKKLRFLSYLIFYLHLGVNIIVVKLLNAIDISLSTSCLCFLITLSITIVCSLNVIKLAEKQQFCWLKQFYT